MVFVIWLMLVEMPLVFTLKINLQMQIFKVAFERFLFKISHGNKIKKNNTLCHDNMLLH